jgi:hypothetical protein
MGNSQACIFSRRFTDHNQDLLDFAAAPAQDHASDLYVAVSPSGSAEPLRRRVEMENLILFSVHDVVCTVQSSPLCHRIAQNVRQKQKHSNLRDLKKNHQPSEESPEIEDLGHTDNPPGSVSGKQDPFAQHMSLRLADWLDTNIAMPEPTTSQHNPSLTRPFKNTEEAHEAEPPLWLDASCHSWSALKEHYLCGRSDLFLKEKKHSDPDLMFYAGM